jgi:microcystin-dependent protein
MFTEQYIGMITVFTGTTPPSGWLFCEGQELPIGIYEPLYTIIGLTYGGDGGSTFALPDMRGRVAVHAGQGAGLEMYFLGQVDGAETVVIDPPQMPLHSHAFLSLTAKNPGCTSQPGTTNDPTNNYPALVNGAPAAYSTTALPNESLGISVIMPPTPSAGKGPGNVPLVSPCLAIRYIICVDGIYPSLPNN